MGLFFLYPGRVQEKTISKYATGYQFPSLAKEKNTALRHLDTAGRFQNDRSKNDYLKDKAIEIIALPLQAIDNLDWMQK